MLLIYFLGKSFAIQKLSLIFVSLNNTLIKVKKMRIINVVQSHNGFIGRIDSFLITEDQLSEDVMETAQKCFIDSIEKKTGTKFSDDDAEEIILNRSYDDLNGYSIELVWSDSVNE